MSITAKEILNVFDEKTPLSEQEAEISWFNKICKLKDFPFLFSIFLKEIVFLGGFWWVFYKYYTFAFPKGYILEIQVGC